MSYLIFYQHQCLCHSFFFFFFLCVVIYWNNYSPLEATCFRQWKESHCNFGVKFNLQHKFHIEKCTIRMAEREISYRNQNGRNGVVQYLHHRNGVKYWIDESKFGWEMSFCYIHIIVKNNMCLHIFNIRIIYYFHIWITYVYVMFHIWITYGYVMFQYMIMLKLCLKFNRANKLLSMTCYLYCLTLGIFIRKCNC